MHRPVLLKESIDVLKISRGDIVVDATLGLGGHARGICKQADDLTVIGIERDPGSLKKAREYLSPLPCTFHLTEGNHRNIKEILKSLNIERIDKALFDLGLNLFQIEESGRGFTFKKKEPLLMTMDDPKKADFTARDIVNEWKEETIADILYGYADERYARRIARAIVERRKENEINTTFDLVETIEIAVPVSYLKRKIHPATKTFQALRIVVNDELRGAEEGIRGAFEALNPGGRTSVITFHSTEDRMVKNLFRQIKKEGRGKPLFKKPLGPSRQEIKQNPGARSAKLRAIEKIPSENKS